MGATRIHLAIYEQIHREHAALRALLSRVDRTLNDQCVEANDVVELLCRLYDALRNHFHCEEEGGFYAQISSDAPRLTGRTRNLSSEHRDLLSLAANLVQSSTECWKAPMPWQTLREEFQILHQQLRQHESEENQLLQEAYQDDFGGND
jgi:iron-sulfur cluster repair protein YtfE (RIC family)